MMWWELNEMARELARLREIHHCIAQDRQRGQYHSPDIYPSSEYHAIDREFTKEEAQERVQERLEVGRMRRTYQWKQWHAEWMRRIRFSEHLGEVEPEIDG